MTDPERLAEIRERLRASAEHIGPVLPYGDLLRDALTELDRLQSVEQERDEWKRKFLGEVDEDYAQVVQERDALRATLAKAEACGMQGIVAHWHTQGGTSEFGDIGTPQNADEAVSAILSVVRKREARPPEPPQDDEIVRRLIDRAKWYRDGCEGLEDRNRYYTSGDCASDAASDLEDALSEIRVLEGVIRRFREGGVR
jgi:hypothetical protein